MQVIQAGIEKANGTATEPLRAALKTVELESIKGKIKFRDCDNQAVQQGFMVKVVKKDGYDMPIPEVIATFPGERTTPGCKKTTYDD
jgi:branched-chain amino acid transport system substrate-binding protein